MQKQDSSYRCLHVRQELRCGCESQSSSTPQQLMSKSLVVYLLQQRKVEVGFPCHSLRIFCKVDLMQRSSPMRFQRESSPDIFRAFATCQRSSTLNIPFSTTTSVSSENVKDFLFFSLAGIMPFFTRWSRGILSIMFLILSMVSDGGYK